MRFHSGTRQHPFPLNPLETAAKWRPHDATIFRESFKHAFMGETTWGAVTDLWTTPDIDEGRIITEEEWTQNYARPTTAPHLEWHERMTITEAEVVSERADREFRYGLITRNATEDWSGWLAKAGGALAPQFLDPVNYLPLAGMFARAAQFGSRFRVSATAAYGTEFGLIETGRQGLFLARDRATGKDFNAVSGFFSIALGLGIGMGYGMFRDLHRAAPFQQRVQNLGKAWDDLLNDEPISDLKHDPNITQAPIEDPLTTDAFDLHVRETRKADGAFYMDKITPEERGRYAALASFRTRVIQSTKQCVSRFKGRT